MARYTPRTRNLVAVVLLYLGLAVVLTSLHGYNVNYGESAHKRAARHAKIIDMRGDSPWAYRLAVPFVAEGVSRALAPLPIEETDRREMGYLSVRFVAMFVSLLALHRFQRYFLPASWALGGTVLFAALHGPSFEHYWFQPASAPDLMLWLLAAVLTMERRDAWLFPMVLLGALNRETVVFLIPIHVALRWGREPLKPLFTRAALLGVTWAVPFLALRQLVEVKRWASNKTAVDYLTNNLTRPEWIAYALSFAGAWLIVPFLGWRHLPPRIQRLILVMGPYLGLIFAFGRIREVRLLLPLCLAFIPATMLVLQRWDSETSGGEGALLPADGDSP
jgi:hypothetical protein